LKLKELLNNNKNDCIQTFLQGLKPTESNDYSLWKVTKKIKQVKKPSPRHKKLGQEATSTKHTLSVTLRKYFSCIPHKMKPKTKGHLSNFWRPHQLEPPINCLKRDEVQEVINSLNLKKSLGYDLITGIIIKELPTIGIKYSETCPRRKLAQCEQIL
jgi:hypothetical protein